MLDIAGKTYADVAQTAEWVVGSRYPTVWTAATEDAQKHALVRATRRLDQLDWISTLDTPAKRRQSIDVQHACSEWALAIVGGFGDGVEPPIESISAGEIDIQLATDHIPPLSEEESLAAALDMPVDVLRLIGDYLTREGSDATGVVGISDGLNPCS